MFSLAFEHEQRLGKSQVGNQAPNQKTSQTIKQTTNQYTKQIKILSFVLAFILAMSTLMTNTTLTNESVAYANAEDVTSYIDFSSPVLTSESKGPINAGGGITFAYEYYTFSFDWAVNFSTLETALGRSLQGGDFFTFKVPGFFGGKTMNILKDGEVWAELVISSSGVGTITFNENVVGKENVGGSLSMEAQYTEKTVGKDVTWTFKFGDDEPYIYSGISEGKDVSPSGNGTSTAHYYKEAGQSATDNNAYYWYLYVNMRQESWNCEVTVTDTLGTGQRMSKYLSYVNDEYSKYWAFYGLNDYSAPNAFGLDGSARPSSLPYYFAISVVDWNTMRADYNKIIQWNEDNNYSTIHYYSSDGTSSGTDKNIDGVGILYDSNYSLTGIVDNNTYTTFMRSIMLGWSNADGTRVYQTPYTGGLEDVIVTNGGFTLVFPEEELDGKSIRIMAYSEITAPISPSTVSNSFIVTGEELIENPVITGSTTVRMKATIYGETGQIKLYKYDSGGRTPLSDVSFNLKEDTIPYDATEMTNTNGVATFNLLRGGNGFAGTYTLSETEQPDGFQPLEDITLEVNSAGEITHINGTTIPMGAAEGTIVTDADGKNICQVGPDRLVLIVYNYESEEVNIGGTKELLGRALSDDEFEFVLKDENANELETVSNKADGTFDFSSITFDSPGIYNYTVEEKLGTLEGITYDSAVFPVTITVTEESNGTLSTEVTYPDGDILFVNKYSGGILNDTITPVDPDDPDTDSDPQDDPDSIVDPDQLSTDPADPVDSASGDGSIPSTGDSSSALPFVLLGIASMLTMGAYVWSKKRRA